MKNVIIGKNMLRSLVLIAGLVISAFNVQAGLILSFGEEDIAADLNETFTVDLYADTGSTAIADGIHSFNLDLSFDNSILNFESFSLGGLFVATSSFGGAFTPIFSSPSIPATLVAIGSDILLGTFTFTAIDYGTIALSTISESFEHILPLISIDFEESASAKISVTDSSAVAVPEPATLGFFIIGALALFGLRRKV